MQDSKRIQKSVNLPVYMWEELKKQSEKQGISISILIFLELQEKYGKKAE